MKIEDKLLTMGASHGRVGVALDAQGVLVHYVGNPGSTAIANRNYFENGSDGSHASAHYIVGLNGEILRCVPENERAAHAGKSYAAQHNEAAKTNNARYIGIENCHPDASGQFSAATCAALVELVADIFTRHGWGAADVAARLMRHYDVTGKLCPAYYVKNPNPWVALKNGVCAKLVAVQSTPTGAAAVPQTTPQDPATSPPQGATAAPQAAPTGTPIMGKAVIPADTLAAFLLAKNPAPKLNGVDAPGLAKLYASEGEAEGARGDLAFCQSCLETDYWRFGKDVKPEQNNFAGLGATGGGNPGVSFPSAQTGVRAQVQHLKAYASAEPLKQACVDPRYGLVTPKGKAPTVERLSGAWAEDTGYGAKILAVYAAALAFKPPVPAPTPTPTPAPAKTPEETTVDDAIADGVITDRLHWLGVLTGTVKPVPAYVKMMMDNAHGKLKK